MHDLPVAETNHPKAEACQVRVSRAVSLERFRARMMLATIHLDHEAAADEEVDSTDPDDVNLATDAPAERWQPEPAERLDARLADPDESGRGVASGKFVVRGHEAEMERTIERDCERLERAASFEVEERIRHRCNRTVDDFGGAPPVQGERSAARIASASMVVGISRTHGVGGQRDVKPSIRDHPDTT